MKNIIYIGSFAIVLCAFAVILSFINVNSYLAKNNMNEENLRTIDPNEDMKILNHQIAETEPGKWTVSGQAQNMGRYKIRYTSLEVCFYDKNGKELYSNFASKSFLDPCENWNFEVVYRGTEIPGFYQVKVGPTV